MNEGECSNPSCTSIPNFTQCYFYTMGLTQTETLLQNKYFHFPLAMWSRVSSSGIHIKISPHHLTEKKHGIVFSRVYNTLTLVHGKVYSIQHYLIMFVNDLRKIGGFLWFSPPINLTTTI